jgi:hypothetical protein
MTGPKLHLTTFINHPAGLQCHPTKSHPVNILMKSLYYIFIREIETVLQYVQPNHQSDPPCLNAIGRQVGPTAFPAVIGKQPLHDIIPINAIGQKHQFMILLQRLLKKVKVNIILFLSIIGHGLILLLLNILLFIQRLLQNVGRPFNKKGTGFKPWPQYLWASHNPFFSVN